MATHGPRPDAENLKRLEELRPAYERLRTERIRAEGEIERLARELEAARAEAQEVLGTQDEEEIRRLIEEARADNARRLDAFAAELAAIEARLDLVGDKA
jgi:hypothetical protein